MMIIDGHLDLAWNGVNWNRDLTRSISEIRKAESGMKEGHRGASTVCFEEMHRGEVAICLATVLARSSGLNEPLLDYRSREIASAMAVGQLAYYRILEAHGYLRGLRSHQDLETHLRQWNETKRSSTPLGYILCMEGADPILSPDHVARWWEDGLRVAGLAHYGVSAYAHGTGASGGLTASGVELLRAMDDVGMILDTTHLSDQSFWQALEGFQGSVLASHCNCRSLVSGGRQLSDDQIRYLIERDSVIGVALDSWMLHPGYVPGKTPNTLVTLDRVIDHIDHVCQLAGGARHVAVGSDLDGGFGKEQSPNDLETIADLQKIPRLLRMRGYKEIEIQAIMHDNWLRFFQKAWTADPR